MYSSFWLLILFLLIKVRKLVLKKTVWRWKVKGKETLEGNNAIYENKRKRNLRFYSLDDHDKTLQELVILMFYLSKCLFSIYTFLIVYWCESKVHSSTFCFYMIFHWRTETWSQLHFYHLAMLLESRYRSDMFKA